MTGAEKQKLARVVEAVQQSLTPDLLRPKYRGDPNPVAGHCAVATEAVYFLLGGKESGLTPTQMSIEGDTHWFLRAKDGSVIDPTASQFSCPVPYEQGRGRGFPTPKRGLAVQPPSARAQKVIDRARRLLGENLAGLTEARQAADDLGVTLDIGGRDRWTLSRIVVPKDRRGTGVGAKVMEAVVREADKDGVVVALTPSTDFGATSKARLVAFYKRFGFVENKGRNKDFAIGEAMYRLPQKRLDGLPKRGRVPLATAKRALSKLGRKAASCGITASALRDGMEVEREHRDVTRGGALATARIAVAHLCESPVYYRELRKLEKRLKRR